MSHRAAFELFNPQGLYDPTGNGYSHGARVETPARFVFLAGQGGEDSQGLLADSFAAQARQALANVRIALQAQGADFNDVFKLTLLIVDHSQQRLGEWVAAIGQAWGAAMKPACTLIPVPRLALDGMLVEIEAMAVIAGGHGPSSDAGAIS
ncbi:RidA family protein [Pseudomonas sp. LJDD11]|uniref:RidA family protein n=1 Tax=Pseudomonas sp. LJDD11 TaxID=2931984 RepID=UPI00211BFF4B|nr:RidA family protein [Pseudomonas sp. LJDD11]MCQ9422557.1 RidA family protein [Pseudomonas sp. LJDD11]